MTRTSSRDDFYRICTIAAALILAVALGVPAAKGPSVDVAVAASPAPAAEEAGADRASHAQLAQAAAGSLSSDARW